MFPMSRTNLVLLALGVAGAAYAWRAYGGRRDTGTPSPYHPVRNAGTEEMTLPMRRWDKVDEAVDQTFPASDPATTY